MVKTADGTELPANWPEVVAGEYPFGHAKFRPSPDRPLGYRGCQNGWFPGATPPLKFSDGTVEQAEIAVRDKWDRLKKRKDLTLKDDNAVNIRFKTPMPGWSLSQPLPVRTEDGKLRIIVKCHPWWVACIDGQTGEILWKDELSPFHCRENLSKAEADRIAETMTLVWAAGSAVPSLMGHRHHGFTKQKKTVTREKHPDLYKKLDAALIAMEKQMKELEPDFAPKVAAIGEAIKEDIAERVRDQDSRRLNQPFNELKNAFMQKYGSLFNVWFSGYTGLAMPAPVSDGKHVYVTFGQGQVACYRLDGRRVWAREIRGESSRSMYYASPALIGNRLVLYRAPEQKSGLVALDTATGKTVWETEGGTAWAKVTYTSIRPMQFETNGKTVDTVIARYKGQFRVLRASDGKDLGPVLRTRGYSAGPGFVNNTLIASFSSDGRKYGTHSARLHLSDPEMVRVTDARKLRLDQLREKQLSRMPSACSPAVVIDARNQAIVDPATGKMVAKYPIRGDSVIIAGRFAISGSPGMGTGFVKRGRVDGWATMNFSVIDISDPARPKVVSTDNLLVSRELPADLSFDRFLTPHGLDKKPIAGAYTTILAHFGCANSGPVPHGNRLFIQSATHLYCIGKPAE
ncbi:MAG: PQQ-binding-like beta-propeller repeat protein [Phycisphaerae bacterium]